MTKISNKKKQEKKKDINPFEVHFNKQKFNILGRKVKNDKGLPGVSRSKALIKRKHTLLHEYRTKNKTNLFVDKRIGERNTSMTNEDRMLARFAAEQKKAHKATRFNLADDTEELTHRGRALTDVEMQEDPRSDEEEDDEMLGPNAKGNLTSDFVSGAHFGGGVLSVNKEDSKDNEPQTRQQLIDKLILESKQRKIEKLHQKEKTLALTEKLDSQWKEIYPEITQNTRHEKNKDNIEKLDDYDIVLRQLKFESRGKPTDKLKSEETIQKEEFERLKHLEEDRLMRMQGTTPEKKKPKHRSADDLDDGLDLMDEVTDEMEIIYDKDGNLITNINGDNNNEYGEEDEEEEEEEESENEDEDNEDEDNLSDLKEESENEEEENNININKEQNDSSEMVIKTTNDLKMIEQAERELPYTFKFPETYEEFAELLDNKIPNVQSVIIERLIKCHPISLDECNKERLQTLFTYLLQHLQDVALQNPKDCFKVLDLLVSQFYDLAQISPSHSQYCLEQVLKDKHSEFINLKHKKLPHLDTIIFLKLIPFIFPTSDFIHSVSTPAILFIDQIMSLSRIRSQTDIINGLFYVTLYMEYASLSKRFCPSIINFLKVVFYMSYPEFEPREFSTSSFKLKEKLLLIKKTKEEDKEKSEEPKEISLKLSLSDITCQDEEDRDYTNLREKCIYMSLKMFSSFLNDYDQSMTSCWHIFESFAVVLNKIKEYHQNFISKIPQQLNELLDTTIELLSKILEKPLTRLMAKIKKPKLLKLYEPEIKKVYDNKKHRSNNPEKNQRDKLLHKIKREKKGALREIRRDRDFLAKIKLKETLRSDAERMAKVKEIYGHAATQQGELRALKRKK